MLRNYSFANFCHDSNVRYFYPHNHKRQFDIKRGSLSMQVAPKTSYYHEYPNLLRTQVEVISDLNYLVCILFEI